MLGANVEILVSRATKRTGFVYPPSWRILMYFRGKWVKVRISVRKVNVADASRQ